MRHLIINSLTCCKIRCIFNRASCQRENRQKRAARRRLKCKSAAVFTRSLGKEKERGPIPANHRRTMGSDQSSTVKSALIPRRIFSRFLVLLFFALPPLPRPCVIDSDVDMAIGRGRIDVDEYVECERHRCVPLALSPLIPPENKIVRPPLARHPASLPRYRNPLAVLHQCQRPVNPMA